MNKIDLTFEQVHSMLASVDVHVKDEATLSDIPVSLVESSTMDGVPLYGLCVHDEEIGAPVMLIDCGQMEEAKWSIAIKSGWTVLTAFFPETNETWSGRVFFSPNTMQELNLIMKRYGRD